MGMKDHESGPNKYAKALCQHMATLWVAIKLVGGLDLLVLLQKILAQIALACPFGVTIPRPL